MRAVCCNVRSIRKNCTVICRNSQTAYCSHNSKSLFFSRQLFYFCPITLYYSNSYPYAFYANNLFYCINEKITFSSNTKKFNRTPLCLINLIKIVVFDFMTCSTFVLRKIVIGVTSSESFNN